MAAVLQHNAISVACAFGRHKPAFDVLHDVIRVTFERVAPTPGTPGRDMDNVARPDRQNIGVSQIYSVIAVGVEQEYRIGARLAFEHAPRPEPRPVTIPVRHFGVRRLCLEPHFGRKASAVFAGAPELGAKPYRRIFIGTSASLISTGVFFRKDPFAPDPSAPSSMGLPPAPPAIGPMDAITRRPVLLSTLFTFMIGPPLQGEAGSDLVLPGRMRRT